LTGKARPHNQARRAKKSSGKNAQKICGISYVPQIR